MSIAKAILSLLAALPVACAAAGFNVLLDQLEADHSALSAAERDFRQRRDGGELSAAAAADYASYLETLRGRVAADCLALIDAGVVLPAGSPCTEFSLTAVQPLPLDQGVPLNSAGRTGKLDAELEAGLGEFDELLLREQERVRASAPRSGRDGAAAGGDGGSGSGQAGSAGDSGLAGAAGSAATGSAGSEAQQGQDAAGRPPGAGAGGEGAVRRSGAQGQPPGIPDGSDDDVVARQLREAAEQEADPELQKKLWEEYRRYKQGIR
jgi:hypothetical protein